MNNAGLESLLFLLLVIPPLIFLQRFLQRDIQSIFLLITRHPEISMALFSLIFFPGILLHEVSHYLAARLLGVRTGRFSLIPKKMDNGHLQLGYVETASTDFFRDSLIGAAPLIVGGFFIAIIGVYRMGLAELWGNLSQLEAKTFITGFKIMFDQPDFWIWFYLAFTISSTMMPSPSDRKAWLPLIIMIVILMGIILTVGAGPWIFARFGVAINSALKAFVLVFGSAMLVHLVLLPPVWMVRKLLSRLTGYQVV